MPTRLGSRAGPSSGESTSMSTSLVPGVSVPHAAPVVPTEAPAPDDLLSALPGRIEPVRRSRAYRFRLALAALTLLLVLIIYLALVVITSYGVWSHFTSDAFAAAVRRILVDPLAYIAFCIAGPILSVFLVKPIFTMRSTAEPAVTLDRSAEPRLFAFVERLCAAQRAPAPRKIRVDTDINASASLRHGLISLFRDDLVLTVGLPLARTMTVRELTGVLAHEFGHFAQGGAMRLSYLIRTTLVVMLRIVHERDGFDEMLIELGRFRFFLDARITLVVWLFSLFMLGVQGFLWLARGLLRGLVWLGMVASGALLREMEYDADRHEARVAGSDAFAAVGKRLVVLTAAADSSRALQELWWRSSRLADDLPALVAAAEERLTARPGVAEEVVERAMQAPTGRLDTHPALRDRLASVAKEAEPGAFRVDAPASILFSDLEGLCRAATLVTYRTAIGPAFSRALIVPVADLLLEVEGDPAAYGRMARFAQGCPITACRMAVGPSDIIAPDGAPGRVEALRSLEAARQRVLDLAHAAIEAAHRLDEARERHGRFGLVVAIVQARCPVDLELSGMPAIDAETALAARRQAGIDLQAAGRDLAPISEALSDRLRAALRLRHAPDVAAGLTSGGDGATCAAELARCEAIAVALAALDSVRRDIDDLQSRLGLILGLLQRAANDARFTPLLQRAYDARREVGQLIKTIRAAVDEVPYPYPAANLAPQQGSETPTIGAFLGRSSSPTDAAGAYSYGVDVLSRLRTLEARLMASLVAVAEHVETSLGLPPLPDPPRESDESPSEPEGRDDRVA
jgi:Zn-dependent protease with chaperone function